MNAKQRYLAKKEAQEEAYYKGLEAPQTKMVDTGNGFTQVQTNSDKNGPVNAPAPQKQNTTLQNYKPVEGKPVVQEQPQGQPQPQEQSQVVGNSEAPAVPSNETQAQAQAEEDADVTGQVGEVDEGTMDKVGINPKNTEQENKKNTENIINKITGDRNKDGTYKPLGKWEYADGIQQFGMLATIASIGLAVLTRGAFPPVDFSMFTGLNESYANYVKGINNYNDYVRQAQAENAYDRNRAEGSIDDAKKTAELNAAGEDHSKEVDAKWAEYLKNVDAMNAQDKAKLDHKLEVDLQDVLTEGKLQEMREDAKLKMAIMELMYKQDINRISDTAKAVLKANLSMDDLNKVSQFVKAQGGMTYFENFLKSINAGANVANAGANLVNSLKPGVSINTGVNGNNNTGSDAGTKEFFKRMIKF